MWTNPENVAQGMKKATDGEEKLEKEEEEEGDEMQEELARQRRRGEA